MDSGHYTLKLMQQSTDRSVYRSRAFQNNVLIITWFTVKIRTRTVHWPSLWGWQVMLLYKRCFFFSLPEKECEVRKGWKHTSMTSRSEAEGSLLGPMHRSISSSRLALFRRVSNCSARRDRFAIRASSYKGKKCIDCSDLLTGLITKDVEPLANSKEKM